MSGYTFIKKKASPGLKTSVYVRKISIHLKKNESHGDRCVGSLFVANQWYLSLWFAFIIPGTFRQYHNICTQGYNVVYLWLSALVYIIRKYLHLISSLLILRQYSYSIPFLPQKIFPLQKYNFFGKDARKSAEKYKIQNTKLQKKGNGIRIVMGGRRRGLIDRLLYYYNNIIIYR